MPRYYPPPLRPVNALLPAESNQHVVPPPGNSARTPPCPATLGRGITSSVKVYAVTNTCEGPFLGWNPTPSAILLPCFAVRLAAKGSVDF